MSQNTQGQGHPREVCMLVKRSMDKTAGTSRGIASTKSNGRRYVVIRGADVHAGNLRMGITGATQDTEPHANRLESVYLFDDDFVGRFRNRLVEHKALVPCTLDHSRERHDADGRESHHSNIPISRAGHRRKRVKLRVADVNQEDTHEKLQSGVTVF